MSALIPGVLLALAAVFFVLYPIVAGREASMGVGRRGNSPKPSIGAT